ncbi:unnamed protein product [Allacma fusca]|uniref:Uncharacterized protein n=1 Tax=Allacma fusca TaxID=39272 RepID=A0A8J2NRS4_9HEXA|nr:unnamed protein product [Allacma fusca]
MGKRVTSAKELRSQTNMSVSNEVQRPTDTEFKQCSEVTSDRLSQRLGIWWGSCEEVTQVCSNVTGEAGACAVHMFLFRKNLADGEVQAERREKGEEEQKFKNWYFIPRDEAMLRTNFLLAGRHSSPWNCEALGYKCFQFYNRQVGEGFWGRQVSKGIHAEGNCGSKQTQFNVLMRS